MTTAKVAPMRACSDDPRKRVEAAIALSRGGRNKVSLLYGTKQEHMELSLALAVADPGGKSGVGLKDASGRGL